MAANKSNGVGTASKIASLPAFPGVGAGGKPASGQPGYRQLTGNAVTGVQPGTKAGGNDSTVTGK